MKYVMLETASGFKVPVLFHEHLNHIDVARKIQDVCGKHGMGETTPVGAGFVEVDVNSVYGRSTTLDLEPSDGDAAYIELGLSSSMLPVSLAKMYAKMAKEKRP